MRAGFIALLVLCLALAGACGGSEAGPAAEEAAVAPETGQAEDPLDGFNALLQALNNRDAEGVWSRLSTDAQAAMAREEVVQMVADLTSSDPGFRVTLQSVNNRAQAGDKAQLGLTLNIAYQGQDLPLTDVAFLVLEDGEWRLSDHFLQTALTAAGLGAPPMEPRVFRADGCVEGDVLAGVYVPSRLRILDPCVTVEGIVREVYPPERGEGDGDLSFNVEVFGDDLHLINDGNRENMNGWLHMEIVPGDQATVPAPEVGQRIRVRGPWVLDSVHGHNEVHPVWSLEVLGD